MHLLHDFLKGVFPQPWVDGRVDHGNEIPQGLGREKTPQVDRHGDFNRAEL